MVGGVTWPASAVLGKLSAPQNTPPTLAQPIVVNGGAAVTGKTASLSVLGRDDGGESNLKYTWSVKALSGGGTATFSSNGTNAAKRAATTFTKAGTYMFTVRIVDAGGLSVSTSSTVVVTPAFASVGISAGGRVINPSSILVVSSTSQALVAQGLDQFGIALATQPTFTWSTTTIPSSAPTPVLTARGGNVTITFGKAGDYGLSVQARATGGVSRTANVAMRVLQVLSAARNVPTAPVSVLGTTLQPPLPTFVDQFGDPMTVPPALTWSTTSLPGGAPAPKFTTQGIATTVTFGKAGNYSLTARAVSVPSISFVTTVVVSQTLTSIAVSPSTWQVFQGCDQQFTAQGFDQFRQAMSPQPTFAWSASSGTISGTGLFTAPGYVTACTVIARSGSVTGTAAVTVVAGSGTWNSAALGNLIESLDADGSINRQDMIQILRSTGTDGSIDAGEFTDLKTLLRQAAMFNMPGYVQTLAGDVVNGNPANAKFQGATLGNLAAGSSAAQLNTLVDKWFLGADHPALCNTSLVYRSVAGTLFPHTPSHTDEFQGQLGDCYLISALGTLADSSPAAVQNMFIDNGDGTFTVRFYTGTYGTVYNWSDGSISAGFKDNHGTADYVTVDLMLPTSSSGMLVYAGYGSDYADPANALWIPLAEKAYAQWNETGKEGRDGLNAYASIQGGWMATVDAQVLGYNATDYIMTRTGKQVAIDALAARKAVTIGTLQWSGTKYGLYASHAYAIVGYNASTDKFTLYNPWGTDHPGPLSWSQLQETCSQLAVADTSGSTPILGAASLLGNVKTSSHAVSGAVAAFHYESAPATFEHPDLAPVAAPRNVTSAAAAALGEVFDVPADHSEVHARPTRMADPKHDALPAPLVDATFGADGLLLQSGV
jgi:hypothetical protein